MKNPFRKREVANAWGSSVEEAAARPFRKFFRIACLAAGILVLAGACVVSWQRAHSLPAKLEAMENDVSRILADALAAQRSGELPATLERGQALAAAWRARFKNAKPGADSGSVEKLLRLQNLEEKLLPRWRRILAPQDGDAVSLSWEDRLRIVRTELLVQQELWPPPPAPPLQIVLSDGFRKMSDGVVVGLSWPWIAGSRSFEIWTDANARTAKFSEKMRVAFFPWRLGALSFPWILGFGALAAAAGYFLCWLGMKANSAILSFMGLLYFLYMVVFVVCLMFLVAGVMK